MTLRVSGVIAGYGSGDVLQETTFELKEGTIGCIVGPNGAGKSTVLRTISGLLRPREGEITLGDEPLHDKSPAAIVRAGISQVPQTQGLFGNLTVRENVLMGAWTLRRQRKLVAARLSVVENIFPIVAQRRHDKAGNLSGGQRRQVEFARALMLRPRLVLLDEPSLGLDPQNLVKLRESIQTVHSTGATVLMVEQQVKFGLTIAHYGIVMERGGVVMAGPAHEILANPEMASLYFGGSPGVHP